MKKTSILLLLAAALLWVTLPGYMTGPGAGVGGPAMDRTGSTSAAGCSTGAGCHSTTASSLISVSVQVYSATGTTVTSYTPGQTYTVTISGVNTITPGLPKFGFQLACVKSAGAGTGAAVNAGTFSASTPTGTHLSTVGGISIFEHGMPLTPLVGGSTPPTVYRDSIIWTAPVAGTGTVEFFGVLNAVNFNGSADPGDLWNASTATLTEASTTVGAISGASWVCSGSTTTLSDATAGGVWSSSNTAVASISSTGVVTGVTAGTSIISYTVSGSSATSVFSVLQSPGPISGASTVCAGSSITLSDATTGGLGNGWISSNAAVATAGSSTGVVGGVSAGSVMITYTIVYSLTPLEACYSSTSVSVNSATPPAIGGSTTVCLGQNTTLTDAVSGGTWASSNTAKATVTSAGVVHGVSAGTAVISYTTTNSCGTGSATTTVTISTAGACNNGVAQVEGSNNALSVYPNPNTGAFIFNLNTDLSETVTVEVTNILGIKVHEFKCYSNMPVDIRLSQPAGIYFISAFTDRNRYTGRIVVQ